MLLQGILAYVVPLFWLALLLTAVPAVVWHPPPDYFPDGGSLFPVFPSDETAKAIGLALGVVTLLLLPKLLILAKAIRLGAAPAFGGAARCAASVACEIALTSVMAPIMLMFQTRAVLQVLSGRDGGVARQPAGGRRAPARDRVRGHVVDRARRRREPRGRWCSGRPS